MNSIIKPIITTLSAILVTAVTISESYAQTLGFTQQENVRVAGKLIDTQLYPMSLVQKQVARVYYDGLNRPVQTVAIQASPAQNDLIQPVVYDNLGRQTQSLLPYAGQSTDVMGSYRPNAVSTDQPNFYGGGAGNLIATDGSPFTKQVFENSPLQRLLNSGMVGDGFQPGGTGTQYYKTVKYRSNSNTVDGAILLWNPDGTYTPGTVYSDNTLAVTDAKDEDNVESLVYTDITGHTILKRQYTGTTGVYYDTYYIYNMAGMLKYIVPPKATNLLAANSYDLTVSPLSTLVFKYTYDALGRLSTKTVPSKGTMFIVYDNWNRPVAMQDANMNANKKWNYIKYDVKGRVICQGIYVDLTHTTLSQMQTYVSSFTTSYESRSGTLANGGYYTSTSTVFPNTGATPLAYAYYDDYDLYQNGTSAFTYQTQSDPAMPGEIGPTPAKLKGVPTMVSKTTIGAGVAANTWLMTVTFYDKRGNPIQVQSNNHLYYLGATTLTDFKTVVPDFTGAPTTSKVVKQSTSVTKTQVLTTFYYDHMYRPMYLNQKYNTAGNIRVAWYNYNELGQLVDKKLHSTDGTNFLQSVDYRYNIRGQLLTINNSKLSNDGVTNNDTNDLFGMEFLYNKVDANLGNTASFNGKLSAVKWMSKDASGTSSYERSYKYTYDALDRLINSAYAERTTTGTTFSNNIGGFDENVTYNDANGNITALTRNSSTPGANTNIQVDNLSYTYDSNNPNQLQKVSDGTGANYTGYGFRNLTGVGSTATYTYDANGNLTADPYKGLSITYDDLNKTDKITVTTSTNRFINYTYDAGGTLLRKQQYDNNVLGTTTDYVDGFVYTTAGTGNNSLYYFDTPEGRVTSNFGTLTIEYVIKDQQGNARMMFKDNGSGSAVAIQENSYYSYGLIMPGSPVGTPTNDNRELYNGGSEWQKDYGNLPDYYETFYRNYDAALGRFIGVDPKAASSASMNPYQYANLNPVMHNDPLGDNVVDRAILEILSHSTGLGGTYDVRTGETQIFDDNSQTDYVNAISVIQTTIAAGGGGSDGGKGGMLEVLKNGDLSAGALQEVTVSEKALTWWEIYNARVSRGEDPFEGPNGDVIKTEYEVYKSMYLQTTPDVEGAMINLDISTKIVNLEVTVGTVVDHDTNQIHFFDSATVTFGVSDLSKKVGVGASFDYFGGKKNNPTATFKDFEGLSRNFDSTFIFLNAGYSKPIDANGHPVSGYNITYYGIGTGVGMGFGLGNTNVIK